jgi:hypothetical protein
VSNIFIRYFLIAIAYWFIFLSGCDSGKETAESDLDKRPVPSNQQIGEQAIFGLSVETSKDYSALREASFAVVLTPKGQYHINQEYPTAFSVTSPPTVTLKKNKLLKPDATRFDEKLAKFDFPFSAAKSGAHSLELKASFAMCTAETCIPFDKTLTITLPVR